MKKSILSLENGLDACLFNVLNEVKNKLGGSTSKLRFRGVRGALFVVFLFCASLAMADTAHADYEAQGTILSNNMLSGATGVSAIASVTVTATLPTNTTAKIKYSQDNVHFYNAAGTEEGWDTISAGTNTIDISARGWSDSIFYYKIELATTDSAATPTISDVQVNYTGSATPTVSGTHYQMQGTLLSTNVLSGASNVTAIGSVTVTATLPGGSTAKIKYSQDNLHFYNAAGTEEGWDTIAAGTNAINISALGWTGGIFYYKLEWSVIDDAQTPVVSDVTLDYTGDVSLPPNCSGHCETSGAFVSTDLLTGVATAMRGTEYFAYSIPNLPGGASVTAQFSQDGDNWYSSDGTLWGADTLSSGVHMKESTALSLATLNWADGTSFYYKLNLTTVDDTQVPVVTYAGLLFAQMTTLNAQLDGPAKSSLVGHWTFDGNDMTDTLAYDRSGQGNTGTLTNGPTKTIGYLGQGLSFDGTDDYVQASNASSLQFANATPITLSAWVNPRQVAAYASFLVKGRDTTDNEANYAFRQTSSGKLDFYYNESGNTNWHVWATSSSVFSTANQWYHVAVTYTFGTGSSIKAYIDGVSIAGSWISGTGNVAPDISTQKLMIGQITTGERFSGLIDDVRIYNTVLTASQVRDLYGGGKITLFRFICGNPLSFTYNGSPVTYGTLTGEDGNCWMDRNLGATRVALSSTDASSYGHLFQWGRSDDGHQATTSATTATNADVPGHGNFITESSSPYDWRVTQSGTLWANSTSTNTPCPPDWHVPTQPEWSAWVTAASVTNAATAYSSTLKLPLAGYRDRTDGSLATQGSFGLYWSSGASGSDAFSLYFYSGGAYPAYVNSRADGFSVRCVLD